ncbi:MAG: hypothetical protein MJ175_05605 [Clostridia bacterium]|nr:hypothetical protein [Clostridia bacterium]
MSETKKRAGLLPEHVWLWLLFLILLSAVCTAAYTVFPIRAGEAGENLRAVTPTAIPDLLICSDTPFVPEDLQKFRTCGTLLEIDGRETVTAEHGLDSSGEPYLVLSASFTAENSLFRLSEGRMPQNDSECVVLRTSAAGLGSVLHVSTDSGTVLTLTVVGTADNALNTFAPYLADADNRLQLIYTRDAALSGAAAFLLTEDTGAASDTITEYALGRDSADSAALAVFREEKAAADVRRKEELDNIVSSCQAQLDALRRTLSEEESAIQAQNEALLALIDDLSAARQAFYSEMEKLEYLATNQVGMITQRDKAETEFAAAQAEIDRQQAALDRSYSDYAALQLHAAAAEDALRAAEEARQSWSPADDSNLSQNGWQVLRPAAENSGYAQYLDRVASERNIFFLPMLVLILCSAVLSFAAGAFVIRRAAYSGREILWFVLCASAAVLIGTVIGAQIVPQLRFERAFALLSEHIMLPSTLGEIVLPSVIAALTALLPPIVCALIGNAVYKKLRT